MPPRTQRSRGPTDGCGRRFFERIQCHSRAWQWTPRAYSETTLEARAYCSVRHRIEIASDASNIILLRCAFGVPMSIAFASLEGAWHRRVPGATRGTAGPRPPFASRLNYAGASEEFVAEMAGRFSAKEGETAVEPGRGTFDRELDLQPRRPPPQPIEPIEDCQRLLANPLLGVLFWIGALMMLRESVRRHDLTLFVWALLFVLVGMVFIQFHCLDCGKTGWLLRSRSHACPAVIARRESKWVRRFRLPGLKVQLVVWLILMMAALVLGMVAIASR
jgi:hypothetical protein